MYFKALLAHDAVVSESVFLVAPEFHVAHKAAQMLYPDSRIVWLFPIDEDDVPPYVHPPNLGQHAHGYHSVLLPGVQAGS